MNDTSDGSDRHPAREGHAGSPAGPQARVFPNTHWSAVLRAGVTGDHAARSEVCKAYWYPVYGFVRNQGCTSEDARDLTQGFFATLLERNDLASVRPERGRFRSWLRSAAKNYLLNELKRGRTKKRGGDHVHVDIGLAEDRLQRDLADALTPEQLFDRCWARAVYERARAGFKAGLGQEDLALLDQILSDDERASDAQTAEAFEISVPALRTRRSRLRTRFVQSLHREVARTVVGPGAIHAELGELLDALA